MPFEDGVGVITEPRLERIHFRFVNVIQTQLINVARFFCIRTAKRVIDYDWVKIADEKYLLPLVSDVRLTIRDKGPIWESRNVIKFKDYQKYGTEVVIRDDDVKPEPEVKKP